jgi:hypothetical protein
VVPLDEAALVATLAADTEDTTATRSDAARLAVLLRRCRTASAI